jgi:hypothetical protein
LIYGSFVSNWGTFALAVVSVPAIVVAAKVLANLVRLRDAQLSRRVRIRLSNGSLELREADITKPLDQVEPIDLFSTGSFAIAPKPRLHNAEDHARHVRQLLLEVLSEKERTESNVPIAFDKSPDRSESIVQSDPESQPSSLHK